MQKSEMAKVIEEGGQGVCGGFEGVVGVRGNRIDQREGADHRAERKLLRLTYRQGSSSLNDLTADGVTGLYLNWRHCDYDYVSSLLGAEVSGRATHWLGVALIAVVAVDWRERCLALALDADDQEN